MLPEQLHLKLRNKQQFRKLLSELRNLGFTDTLHETWQIDFTMWPRLSKNYEKADLLLHTKRIRKSIKVKQLLLEILL